MYALSSVDCIEPRALNCQVCFFLLD